jgi:hypothetical protein
MARSAFEAGFTAAAAVGWVDVAGAVVEAGFRMIGRSRSKKGDRKMAQIATEDEHKCIHV